MVLVLIPILRWVANAKEVAQSSFRFLVVDLRRQALRFAALQRDDWQVLEAKLKGTMATNNEADFIPGDLEELVLLAILKLEPHAYGVAIQELIETATRRKLNVRRLYVTLNGLRAKGWIEEPHNPSFDQSQSKELSIIRRYYAVSALGRIALQRAAHARKGVTHSHDHEEAAAVAGSEKEVIYGI
jgi:DNA-binding PadR family transcriptional regulator